MLDTYTVSFFGHRQIENVSAIEQRLDEIIRSLLLEKEDASLNFFVTLILPLLIDDISTIQGAITFALIILLLSMLLYQTKLFYANPVLAILGYHIYSFQFKHNSEYGNCICIGVCHGRIGGEDTIEFKTISGNVLYIGEMKK